MHLYSQKEVTCQYTCQLATKFSNKINFFPRHRDDFCENAVVNLAIAKKFERLLIHKFIWAIFEKLLHWLTQLLFSTEALDLLSELKKWCRFINKSTLLPHDLLIDIGFMCSILIQLCTTSLTKSFRLVWFVAQSKTTWERCPKNHYFHIVFLNCLFVFEDMWRGALMWGNFVRRFPLTSLRYRLNGNSISSLKKTI